MAFEVTIVKGLIENAIGRLAALSGSTEKHFERVDIRLDAIGAHLESMGKRFTTVEQQLDEVKTMLTQVLARLPEKP